MAGTLTAPPRPAHVSRHGTRAFTFRVFHGRPGLAALRPAWNVLAASRPSAGFHHLPEWYAAYLDSFPADHQSIQFHAAYQDGDLCAVFPLERATIAMGGVSVRALVAPCDDHMPFADFVSIAGDRDEHILQSMLRHLRRAAGRSWDVVSFPRVPHASSGLRLTTDDGVRQVRVQRGGFDTLPVLAYEELLQRVSKNFRGNLRKARNRLQAADGVEFVTARAVGPLRAAYEEFLAVEASGWKGSDGEGTAITLHPRVKDFYLRLIEQFGSRGACEINLLRIAGECVSAQFCIVVRDVYYVLKIGYDERHATFAPGNMLLEHLLKRLSDEGRIRDVNLVSDAEWHDSWHPVRSQIVEIVVANNTLRGLAAVAVVRARARAKRWVPPAISAVKRIRGSVRRGMSLLSSARLSAARS